MNAIGLLLIGIKILPWIAPLIVLIKVCCIDTRIQIKAQYIIVNLSHCQIGNGVFKLHSVYIFNASTDENERFSYFIV